MSTCLMLLLAVQAVIFSIWTVLAFRWLFAIRADAVAKSGSALPGLRATLAAFGGALREAHHAKSRLRFGAATAALFAITLLIPYCL